MTADVVRANHLLRAIHVPAGRHRVITWYSPWSARIGAVLSALALVWIAWHLLRPGIGKQRTT